MPAMRTDNFSVAGTKPTHTKTAMPVNKVARLSLPCVPNFSSIQPSQWCSFSSSKRKFKNTNNKNAPPNAATCAWCANKWREYSCGCCSAIIMTLHQSNPVATATINMGNIRRIPNTATIIPTVKNNFCQNASHVRKMEAFTTALSNDSETSITAKMLVIKRACPNPTNPLS